MRKAIVLCLGVALALPALARDVAGVKVPDSIEVGGQTLALNGVGIRQATMFNVKVYVGALYVTEKTKDSNAIVQADAPKAVHMQFVRDVERGKVMEAFKEGFERNSKNEAKALGPSLDRVAKTIPNEMKPGMRLTVTYVPGQGTTVVGPEGEVTIEGKPFADAMFRNWLGGDAADKDLKNKLLGR